MSEEQINELIEYNLDYSIEEDLEETKKCLKEANKEIERLNNDIKELLKENGNKENVIKAQDNIIKEVREKLLCYGETFDLKIHQDMQKELLEILDKEEK